jgi:hypothetical protein
MENLMQRRALLASAKNATRTAAAIAGSRVEPYGGAPHGLFLTDPARFNRDLLGFVRS